MAGKLTAAKVKAAIKALAREAVSRAREEGKLDEIHDVVFEEVDSWWGSNVAMGQISNLPKSPESEHDVKILKDAVTIMQGAQDAGYGIADDSGLWEGLAPYPAIVTQALFTMERAVGQVAYELVE